MAFIEMTHLNLNFCFDTGHANLMATVDGSGTLPTRIAQSMPSSMKLCRLILRSGQM